MKVLITSDWQLESKPPCDRLDGNGRSIRHAENLEQIAGMFEAAKKDGCEGVIHIGDLSEERNPDSLTLDGAACIFGVALGWGWHVLAVAGNHDGAFYDKTSSSFGAFGRLNDRFEVFHEPRTIKFDGCRLLMLPYLHRKSPEEVTAAAKACSGGESDFLFAHYAFAGCAIGAKNMILPGDHLGTQVLDAAGCKAAFFGHIHKQQVVKSKVPVVFPGSPVICDFGERGDTKGYAILDLHTGEWSLRQMQPRRRWIQVEWKELGTSKGTAKFAADDIVKVVGEYGPGESPQEAFKAAVSTGQLPEPFYKTFDVRRAALATKRGVVSASSGLQKALADYFAERWPGDPLAPEALESASAALKASSPAAFDKSVVLKSVRMTDFLSHEKADVEFRPGEPLLVCGENGLGKTNLIEAVLFSLTGQVSKGLKMASLVRQGASKTVVELLMAGEKGEYRIRRTVTLNSKGAATHKVDVEIKGERGWTSLADGGVVDTQAALGRLVGATFLSMRAVNFQFQRDPNPFIGAEPSERKAILAEILGLDALGRAWKALNDDRLVKMRAKDAAGAAHDEAAKGDSPEKAFKLQADLGASEGASVTLGKDLLKAKATTEAAVAGAGAVGSERNTLQGLIDSLEGQTSGPADLKKAKADLESSYQATRTERANSYSAAKKRAEEKGTLAKDLPRLEKESADLDQAESKAQSVDGKTAFPDLFAAIGKAEAESVGAARTAVDAKMAAREAQQARSDAAATAKGLEDKVKAQDFEIDALQSQDMKTCSKCGHLLDSAHAEAELEKSRALLVALKGSLVDANNALIEANARLQTAQGAESAYQKAADAAAKALSDAKYSFEKVADAGKSKAAADAQAARNALESARIAAKDAEQAERERAELQDAGIKAKEAHEKALAGLDARIAEAEKKAAEARAKADEARAKLAGIDARLAKARADVDAAKGAETEAQGLVDACAASIASLQAEIRGCEARAENARAMKAALDAAIAAWGVADMASQALDPKAGLPVHLIDERLPALADAVNAYLGEFGSPEFSVAFSTRKDDGKETLDVLVDNGMDPRLDVAAYSGGQLDRIEFCLRLALGDLAEEMRDVRLGFSMMDEPGTHLDEDRKGALIRMVRERAADGRCPIAVIVSHDRKLMGAFERRLTVTRDGMQEG